MSRKIKVGDRVRVSYPERDMFHRKNEIAIVEAIGPREKIVVCFQDGGVVMIFSTEIKLITYYNTKLGKILYK